ncbi:MULTISPECIES: hypothetical protein [unclassified Streptomyces]|uniref:hypothetical protein n=1 Tax=unclassified Streptomyces TaxID=2593676 RepID=UPI003D72D023
MVGTMALLPPFIRAARPAKAVPQAAAAGLPADDEVLLDAADGRLGPALVAAGQDGYRPAAELLAATRARGEWERRDRYVTRLAWFAHARPDWFERWRAAAPRDPDALAVAAQLAVDRAWRSPARAEVLREVSPLITAAAQACDRDPVPWRIALDHARGTRAGHKYFGELWEAAVRRAPHHYGCHVAALRYLAASCCVLSGDTPHTPEAPHRECFDFADRAAQDVPPHSLVRALPLQAAFACLTDDCGPMVARERLDAAADRAIVLSAGLPPADPWPAPVRNLLVYVLARLGRRDDALVQLRLLGPYATSFPWDQVADDPLGHFLTVRGEIVRGLPVGPPRRSGGHHAHRPAHSAHHCSVPDH